MTLAAAQTWATQDAQAALHWAGNQSGSIRTMGEFWEEGMVEMLARREFGPRATRHPYDSNVALLKLMSNVVGKVRIKFKVSVIASACLVARAIHLMTTDRFPEGYKLIKDMEANEFLIALRMLAE